MSDLILNAKLNELQQLVNESRRHVDMLSRLATLFTEPGDSAHLLRRILEIICSCNDWVIGQFWTIDVASDTASCSPLYYASAVLPDFRTESETRKFSKGVGLPGRVWSVGMSMHLPDLNLEKGMAFPRHVSALNAGLRSGFAFPLKNGPFFSGVLEFFSFSSMILSDADKLFYDKLGIYLASALAYREDDLALRQQAQLSQVALSRVKSAFVAINEASLITEWSGRAEELMGWKRSEVLGKPLADVMIPERYRDAHMRGLFKYMTTGEGPVLNKAIKAPALHASGDEISVELNIFPIEGFGTKRFGALVTAIESPREPDIVLE